MLLCGATQVSAARNRSHMHLIFELLFLFSYMHRPLTIDTLPFGNMTAYEVLDQIKKPV